MTNPNNAIGTNGAYGGRTSVNAFNDDLAFYTRGVVSGWSASPNSGMTIQLGGVAGYRDVAVAQDNAGNNTSINNISGNPVEVTIDTAPSTNSRIDVVVAYVDNPPQGDSSTVDNPGSCGIIAVKGTASSSPSVPNDSAIRTAITGDGASGATAYYVILAKVTVGTNVTVISAGAISSGDSATMDGSHITAGSVNSTQLNSDSVTTEKIQDGAVTSPKIDFTTLSTNTDFVKSGIITGVTFQGTNNINGGFTPQTYDTPFPSGVTPIVVAVGNVQTGYSASVMITSSTNTGFVFLARTNDTTDVASSTVYWIAINPDALPIK